MRSPAGLVARWRRVAPLLLWLGCSACTGEEVQAGATGSRIKAQVPECSTAHFAFVAGPSTPTNPRWTLASPVFWFVEGDASDLPEAERDFLFEGESVATAIPAPASEVVEGTYLRLPMVPQGLVVPPGALELGQSYQLVARVTIDSFTQWKVVEVRDAAGRLRVLHLNGETYEAVPPLEAMGWQVTFTPACWTDNCYDPLVHHDLTLSDGTHRWSAPDRSDAVVTVGGRPFRVINDAVAVPGRPSNSTCSDVGHSFWNVTLIAQD